MSNGPPNVLPLTPLEPGREMRRRPGRPPKIRQTPALIPNIEGRVKFMPVLNSKQGGNDRVIYTREMLWAWAMVLQGFGAAEVARQLGISYDTTKGYIQRMAKVEASRQLIPHMNAGMCVLSNLAIGIVADQLVRENDVGLALKVLEAAKTFSGIGGRSLRDNFNRWLDDSKKMEGTSTDTTRTVADSREDSDEDKRIQARMKRLGGE